MAASHTAAAAGMQRNANFFIQHSFRKEKSAAQTVLMPLSPFIIALVGGQTKNARGQLSGAVRHFFPLLQLPIASHTDARNSCYPCSSFGNVIEARRGGAHFSPYDRMRS